MFEFFSAMSFLWRRVSSGEEFPLAKSFSFQKDENDEFYCIVCGVYCAVLCAVTYCTVLCAVCIVLYCE